jgi:hypothetical protein
VLRRLAHRESASVSDNEESQPPHAGLGST